MTEFELVFAVANLLRHFGDSSKGADGRVSFAGQRGSGTAPKAFVASMCSVANHHEATAGRVLDLSGVKARNGHFLDVTIRHRRSRLRSCH